MTEGIIQKILEKYRPKRKPNGNYPYFTPRLFEQIEQELIEEVEASSAELDDDILEELIGDSKE